MDKIFEGHYLNISDVMSKITSGLIIDPDSPNRIEDNKMYLYIQYNNMIKEIIIPVEEITKDFETAKMNQKELDEWCGKFFNTNISGG